MINKDTYFYFIMEDKYIICDLDHCTKSDRTFDISFYALANNEKLLDKLQLYYMQGNYGVRYMYESRAEWFCGYISCFTFKKDGRYEKLLANPTIRLLIEDDELLAEVKKCEL
jgi:hypothetical protein